MSSVCRYQNVTFSPTIISISLKVDNMKFARCQDKVIRVPDQRYQNMQNARPATLMSRCGMLSVNALVSHCNAGARLLVSADFSGATQVHYSTCCADMGGIWLARFCVGC